MVMLALLFAQLPVLASDSTVIKVHFIYGSRPSKQFKGEERRWFGGIHGGHVGIEINAGEVFSFVPSGKFHWVANGKHKHSRFVTHEVERFWTFFSQDSVQGATVSIPISSEQMLSLESVMKRYTAETPYDYAFLGMRCAAAVYDILGTAGIMEKRSKLVVVLEIFYPKKLRKKILRKAKAAHWEVERRHGSPRRQWEKD
jgi:hypothetical protein